MYFARATCTAPTEMTIGRNDTKQCELEKVWACEYFLHLPSLTRESLLPVNKLLQKYFQKKLCSPLFGEDHHVDDPLQPVEDEDHEFHRHWFLHIGRSRICWVGLLIIFLCQVTDRSDGVRVLRSCFRSAGPTLCV